MIIYMSGKADLTEKELIISEEVEGISRKEISSFGTGAHVMIPKEHIGKTAYGIVCKE